MTWIKPDLVLRLHRVSDDGSGEKAMSCPRMLRRVAEDAGPLVRMLGRLGVEPRALVYRLLENWRRLSITALRVSTRKIARRWRPMVGPFLRLWASARIAS